MKKIFKTDLKAINAHQMKALLVCKAAWDKWFANEVQPALRSFGDESLDATRALLIGVFKGEAGRAECQDMGGPTWPERTAFEVGLKGGPIARAKLLQFVLDSLMGVAIPAWAAGFVAVLVEMLKATLDPK